MILFFDFRFLILVFFSIFLEFIWVLVLERGHAVHGEERPRVICQCGGLMARHVSALLFAF